MKTEEIECSETSAYIIQTPRKYPKENIMYLIISFYLNKPSAFVAQFIEPA